MRRRLTIRQPFIRTIVSGTCLAPCLSVASGDEPRKPMPIAERLDLWQTQRDDIRKTTLQAMGLLTRYNIHIFSYLNQTAP